MGPHNPSTHFSVNTWLQKPLLMYRKYGWSIYHVDIDSHHGDRKGRLTVNVDDVSPWLGTLIGNHLSPTGQLSGIPEC